MAIVGYTIYQYRALDRFPICRFRFKFMNYAWMVIWKCCKQHKSKSEDKIFKLFYNYVNCIQIVCIRTLSKRRKIL